MIVAHGKHGDEYYESATTLLAERVEDGYWYDEEETEAAELALAEGNGAAWRFLRDRGDYEYERVSEEVVR